MPCVTHHYACDCRERYFAKLEEAVQALLECESDRQNRSEDGAEVAPHTGKYSEAVRLARRVQAQVLSNPSGKE